MTNAVSLARDPRNKFSIWQRSLGSAAILGAVSSVAAALAVFSVVTIIMDTQDRTNSHVTMVLGAALSLFLFGIANLWYTVALMGFGYRAAQFAVSRGVKLRLAPGWAIGGWFVPIASFILPYLVLRDVAALDPKVAVLRQRSLLGFWIWWVLLSNILNYGVQLILSQGANTQLTGWKLFAGAIAFFIVPFMMGRKVIAEINQDLASLIL